MVGERIPTSPRGWSKSTCKKECSGSGFVVDEFGHPGLEFLRRSARVLAERYRDRTGGKGAVLEPIVPALNQSYFQPSIDHFHRTTAFEQRGLGTPEGRQPPHPAVRRSVPSWPLALTKLRRRAARARR